MFQNAIVRPPAPNFIHGLSTANLGRPDYEKALAQHQQYVDKLQICGLSVQTLPANEAYPDSTFVEDVLLHTPQVVVLTRPGAASRQGEVQLMEPTATKLFHQFAQITAPGKLEAGDILQVGDRYFVGLSQRSNQAGFHQLKAILHPFGYEVIQVPLNRFLHLKTGVSCLGGNRLLITGELTEKEAFRDFDKIVVEPAEAYAANSLWLNGKVLMPSGFPLTQEKLVRAGYEVLTTDVSEFEKLDGGLSCLSVRY